MRKLLAVLAILVVVAAGVFAGRRAVRTQSELDSARDSLHVVQHQADLAVQAGVRLSAHADSLARKSHVDSARADSLQQRYSVARSKLLAAIPAASDSCAEIVQLSLDALVASDGTLAAQSEATASAQEAFRGEKSRADTLEGALVALRAASAKLDTVVAAAEPRRSLAARFLPHPGVGVSVGVDALGQPHIIYGIQLGWSF